MPIPLAGAVSYIQIVGFCLATIGVGVFRCGNFGCRTFCLKGVFLF